MMAAKPGRKALPPGAKRECAGWAILPSLVQAVHEESLRTGESQARIVEEAIRRYFNQREKP